MGAAKRLTNWLGVHPKVFFLLGTAVVILTFTIKEAWRDSVKDRVDDLNRDTDLFQIEQLIESTQRNVLISTKSAPARPEDRAWVFQHWQRIWSANTVDTARLGSIFAICKKLTCDSVGDSEKLEGNALDSNAILARQLRDAEHSAPAHHKLEQYLDEYIAAAGIAARQKSPLFRAAIRRTGKLSERPVSRVDTWYMVRRCAKDAGLEAAIGNHSFRAIGFTDYLENGGHINIAKRMAGHANIRTTELYDRRADG